MVYGLVCSNWIHIPYTKMDCKGRNCLLNILIYYVPLKLLVAPTPFVKLIIKRDGFVYIPAVNNDLVDHDEHLVPRSETIMFSNLCQVVDHSRKNIITI